MALHLLLVVLALLALKLSSLQFAWQLAIACVVLGYAGWVLHCLRHRETYGLRWQDGWQLWRSQDDWQDIHVAGQSVVLPQLVVLYYRLAGDYRLRWLVLLPTELGREQHRQLRLWLRFKAQSSLAAE